MSDQYKYTTYSHKFKKIRFLQFTLNTVPQQITKDIAETASRQLLFESSFTWNGVIHNKPITNSSYLGDRPNSSPADSSNKSLVMMACRRRRYRDRHRSSGWRQKTRRFITTLLLSQLIVGVTSVRYVDVVVMITRPFVAETEPAEYHKARHC